MKKLYTLLYILITLSAKADYWTQKADFPGGDRWAVSSFTIAGKGYVGCGIDTNTGQKDFWEYDPLTNVWTQKADFGGSPRWYAAGFSILNKGYIGLGIFTTGGANQIYYSDLWEFDPSTNIWTQKNSFPGDICFLFVNFTINNKGYICSGFDSVFVPSNELWEYEPLTDLWTQKSSLPGIARASATGFSTANKGYIGTGLTINIVFLNDFWEYDPALDLWTQKANFPGVSRMNAASFSIGNVGYLGTGEGNQFGTYLNDFWMYNPITNQWYQKADFAGYAVDETASFSINNKGYIGLGGPPPTDSFWEYTPDNSTGTEEELSNSSLQFTVSPNPAKDYIIISYLLNGKENIHITITDVAGKKVYEKPLAPEGEPQNKISVRDLKAGIYLVEVNNGKQKAVKKLTKE